MDDAAERRMLYTAPRSGCSPGKIMEKTTVLMLMLEVNEESILRALGAVVAIKVTQCESLRVVPVTLSGLL